MTDLKSMSLQEMTEALKALGQPAFRGKQVFTWLHKGATSFDDSTHLPKAFPDRLKTVYFLTVPRVAQKQGS